jgi:hypothetical protein
MALIDGFDGGAAAGGGGVRPCAPEGEFAQRDVF